MSNDNNVLVCRACKNTGYTYQYIKQTDEVIKTYCECAHGEYQRKKMQQGHDDFQRYIRSL